jgi:hypothetical protein
LSRRDKCIQEYELEDSINTSQSFSRWLGVDPAWGLDSTFTMVVIQWMNRHQYTIHQEARKNPMYKPMINQINKLIQKYSLCKVYIDISAANVCYELAHQYGEYQSYEKLDPKILDRFRYTECRTPLIVPVPFNKEGDNMMQTLQSCISKNILRLHPSHEELIISLKSAKNKPNNPYSLDKNTSAYHDILDALRLSLCCLRSVKN